MSEMVERIGELLGQLQSPDFSEREKAVKELGTYSQDEAVAGLVLAMEDHDLGIRELAAEYLSKLRGPTVAQLLIRFLEHTDIGTRNLSSEILVRIGADAVPSLIENVNNADHDVRKFVVDILGLIRDPRAMDPLCARLTDANANVACSAAEALGEIGSPKAVPSLVRAYATCEDSRLQIVEALGKIGDPSTLEQMYGFLKSDDPMVLFAALEAIGKIGLTPSIPQLVPFLSHRDSSISETAMSAIINISARNKGRIDCDLPLDKFSSFLFDGMKRGHKDITEFTLSRLSHWYGSDIIRGLLDVVEVLDEEQLKRVSMVLADVGSPAGRLIVEKLPSVSKNGKLILLDILKGMVDDDIARRLVSAADDPEPEVRQKVAQVLGASGYNGVIDSLKRLTLDDNGHVRAAAYSSIGWLCSEAEVDIVFSGLNDKYPDVREAAMGALIVIGGARVVAKFTADLYHEDPDRQRLAVTALGLIGETDVVEPLSRATNHPDPHVRQSAICALAKMGPIASTEQIVVALNDESSAVRKAAISALITLKGDVAVHDIQFLLKDDDQWVRYHTINAIAELKNPAFSEYLTPFLDDECDIIRIAAAKGLALMGAVDALPELGKLRADRNRDVMEAAQMAMASLGGKR